MKKITLKKNKATYAIGFLLTACLLVTTTATAQTGPPSAQEEEFDVTEDVAIILDVLANDQGSFNEESLTIVNQPSNGTATVTSDFKVNYQPAQNYVGPDSFTYRIGDGTITSRSIVSLSVKNTNDTPVVDEGIPNQTAALNQRFRYEFPQNAFRDPDAGSQLSYTAVTGTGAGGNSDDALPPGLNFEDTIIVGIPTQAGTFEVFIQVEDEFAATAQTSFILTVEGSGSGGNGSLNAVTDNATIDGGVSTTINVLANDTGTIDASTVRIVNNPTNGVASVNADGTIQYTPNTNYSGADSFLYGVSDGAGASSRASVTIMIDQTNEGLAASDSGIPDITVEQGRSVNFIIPDTAFDNPSGSPLIITVDQLPDGLQFDSDNRAVTGQPTALGSTEITVSATDNQGNIAESPFTITVESTDTNSTVTPTDDSASVAEDMSTTIDVASNDTNADPASVTIVNSPTNGMATVNSNGSVVYTPNADYFGQDSFTYQVASPDATSSFSTAVVSLEVTPTEDDPELLIIQPTRTGQVDQQFSFAVGNAFGDVDGDQLTTTVTGLPTGLVFNDGSIEGTPTEVGTFNVTLEATDPTDRSASTNFDIVINDNGPGSIQTTDDEATTDEEVPVTVDVLANDSNTGDTSLDPSTLTIVSQPSNGTATVTADNTIEYTGDANFNGSDSFTYEIGDGFGSTAQGIVSLDVANVNDAPTTGSAIATQSAQEGSAFLFSIPESAFTDADQDDLTITTSTLPDGLTFSDGEISGTPTMAGTNTITLTAQDPSGATATNSFDIEIESSTASIQDLQAISVRVYPNPTTSVWNFDSADEQITQITIYNSLGQQVRSAATAVVNVSDLSAGMYFATVETATAQATIQLIKQ